MAPDQTAHRLAAIMFTDIVGYTTAMAESEAKGHRVRERHRQLLRPLVERYGGTWVQDVGDESLSSFPSAIEAANCALAIQAAVAEEPELRVRIGIHVGDVVVREGSVHGDGVNIAARIRPLAEPGGICVSDEVQHAVQNQENLETRSLGLRELKNVPRPVEVYALAGEAAAPEPVERRPRVRAGPLVLAVVAVALVAVALIWDQIERMIFPPSPIRSLAVLPLENLSGDPEQEYFADGMTDALIGHLARMGALTVISRTSVMQYKQTDKSLPKIAKELNVDGIIEGTVLRDGDRVRIAVQLIDARNGNDTHLWSDQYDRELRDILALHSDVARAVAEQVHLRLSPEERAVLTRTRAVDPRAHDAYLRGVQLQGPMILTLDWAPQAIKQFKTAVELDPNFAEGWAALSLAQAGLGIIGLNLGYRSELLRAREAAERALALDDRLGAAHAVLGQVRLFRDWDFPGARRAYERAMYLSHNDPAALDAFGMYLMFVGKPGEALDVMERVLRVAPRDPSYYQRRPRNFYSARQYERVLDEYDALLREDPDFIDHYVAGAYSMLGRFEDAHRAYLAVEKRCGAPFCERLREARERGWTEGGWEGSWRAVLEVYLDIEGFQPMVVACSYAVIGDAQKALHWLERGYRDRDPGMVSLKAQPAFDSLRSDPRFDHHFDDLVRRIGFPES